jgi:hypothetical protein
MTWCLVKHRDFTFFTITTPQIHIGGVDVQLHTFLFSALDGGESLDSRPGRFTVGVGAPGTHWIRGWVGPRASLDAEKFQAPAGNRTTIVRPVA